MSRIFISYRHEDSKATTDKIDERLAGVFGRATVFRDLASIPLGVDYEGFIKDQLADCSVELVVIGPGWLSAADASGRRRLDDPKDMVRLEIETGLAKSNLLIPLLVNGADIPSEDSLPASLKPLKRRNGIHVGADLGRDAGFSKLVQEITEKLPTQWQPEGWEQTLGPRLDKLGFKYRSMSQVDVIVPPVIQVKAGKFTMGSSASPDETPQHDVDVSEYMLGVYPVTVAEYSCFVRSGYQPPYDKGILWRDQLGYLDRPVVNVSWSDAVAYAAWLRSKTGQAWRLPTEAEWEKAARWDAQTNVSREYPWGAGFDRARCCSAEGSHRSPVAVDTFNGKGASACGAQQMSGNVWEWTSSLYTPYPYKARDGREQVKATGDRVRRGGSWKSYASNLRAAKRAQDDANSRDISIGFRLALEG